MKTNYVLATTFAGLLFTSFSFGQTAPQQTLPDHVQPSAEVKNEDKMKTLFARVKRPSAKINYLGLSVSPQFQYGTLAGQFTPMSGMTGMLHINKKWGIGLGGYSTIDNRFTPTALNTNKALSLRSMYGGLNFEYTPKPNAALHVSFPLLIGAGMAQVDSVGNRSNQFGRRDNNRRDRDFNRLGAGGTAYMVIQPGVNLEANVFRFVKIFAGVSYRIVPATHQNDRIVSTLPSPSAGQLGGFNLNAGLKVGVFDYNLHRAKRPGRMRRTRDN
jgi:hypothetical protein